MKALALLVVFGVEGRAVPGEFGTGDFNGGGKVYVVDLRLVQRFGFEDGVEAVDCVAGVGNGAE